MVAGWLVFVGLCFATGDTGEVPTPPVEDSGTPDPDPVPGDTGDDEPVVILPPSAASTTGETGGFGCDVSGIGPVGGVLVVGGLFLARGRRT